MTPVTFWLGRATDLFIALLLVFGGYAALGRADSSGRTAVKRYLEGLDRKLRSARSKPRASRVLAGQLVAGVLIVGGTLLTQQWLGLLLLPLVALGPKLVIERQVARRVTQVEAQVEPWLVAIANALKASPSLGEAIASTATLVPSPMSEEVELIVKEYELGTPLDQALDNLAARIESKTLAGSVLALKVARKSGGNLPEMLENAAAALRELARLEGVVRTKTAEGKAQAFVISAIPVPMLLGIHSIDPHFFDPLRTTFTGQLVIGGAAVLWAVAILLARKIVAVDV